MNVWKLCDVAQKGENETNAENVADKTWKLLGKTCVFECIKPDKT